MKNVGSGSKHGFHIYFKKKIVILCKKRDRKRAALTLFKASKSSSRPIWSKSFLAVKIPASFLSFSLCRH
jgi:hypothetical protein